MSENTNQLKYLCQTPTNFSSKHLKEICDRYTELTYFLKLQANLSLKTVRFMKSTVKS